MSGFATHRFVVAASTVSAVVAVVVSELLRRKFAKQREELTITPSGQALHHLDVGASATVG